MQLYNIKIKYLVLVTTLWFFCGSTIVHADSGYDVDFRVIDVFNAEIKLTYPVTSSATMITAKKKKKGGSMFDGYRDLISANAQDGSPRLISHNTLKTDSQITVLPGDQKITLTYRLTNTLATDEIAFFFFFFFFVTESPTTALV